MYAASSAQYANLCFTIFFPHDMEEPTAVKFGLLQPASCVPPRSQAALRLPHSTGMQSISLKPSVVQEKTKQTKQPAKTSTDYQVPPKR